MSHFRTFLAQHRAATYCFVTFTLTWAFWFATVYPAAIPLLQAGQNPLGSVTTTLFVGAGMFFPSIGVVLTRLVTGEGFGHAWIKPVRFRRTWKYYVAGWFGPILLVAVGAAVFFLLNPGDFDPAMPGFVRLSQDQLATSGQAGSVDASHIQSLGYAQLALVFIAPLLNCVPCFGEEWGWRGYLLPKLTERHSSTYAVVVSGIVWGLWHAPIIALGHNYGLGYPGWPFTGILMMCCFCMFIGAFFSWLTLRAKSCLPAVFAHGAVNGCVAAPAMFALTANPFVGPAPTGIIGDIGFIVAGVLCVIALRKRPTP